MDLITTTATTTTLLLLLLLHPFNSLFSRTIWVSRHQKGKPSWILLEQEMTEWQWHQLDHMQIICTSLQTDNHASTSPLSFYRPDALPAAQTTASKNWRYHTVGSYTLQLEEPCKILVGQTYLRLHDLIEIVVTFVTSEMWTGPNLMRPWRWATFIRLLTMKIS